MDRLKILALSGSLRKDSYNTSAIRALKTLAPPHVEILIGDISELPLFNPDREGEDIAALKNLKAALNESAGLVIASPEYAHGISGPMKNALDWLVSGAEFPYKPVMLINTSPRASHALEALKEVLNTMSGRIIHKSCVTIPLLSSGLDANGIVSSSEIAGALKTALGEFCARIKSGQAKKS